MLLVVVSDGICCVVLGVSDCEFGFPHAASTRGIARAIGNRYFFNGWSPLGGKY